MVESAEMGTTAQILNAPSDDYTNGGDGSARPGLAGVAETNDNDGHYSASKV